MIFKRNALLTLIHFCLLVISFGGGYIISTAMASLDKGHFPFEKLFWTLLVVFTLVVCAYEVTYKKHKYEQTYGKITFLILIVYILPFVGGYCLGAFF
jgi:cell division protein FtsW (lipid II flippase)